MVIAAFLREWSHYRFGVFEERGFPGDSRYPLFYKVPGKEEAAINDCSNIPLNYSLVDEKNAACELQWHDNNTLVENGCHLDEKSLLQNTEVTSSLMSMALIPNVKEYCRKEGHNIHSPTKQNIMCNYEDVWKVIQASPEVLNTPHASQTPPQTLFNHVQEGNLRIAVLYSCQAQKRETFQTVRTALKYFIEDSLPDGTLISILGYDDSEHTYPVSSKELRTKTDREDLTRNIEAYDGQGETKPIYVERALGKLIEELRILGILEGTTVILVTNGTMADIGKVENAVKQHKIRMHVILTPEDGDISDDIDNLAHASGGKVFSIMELSKTQKDLQLQHALNSTMEGYSSLPNRCVIAEHIIDHALNEMVTYRIPVDPETEHLLVCLYIDPDLSSIDEKTVQLTTTSNTYKPAIKREGDIIWFSLTSPEVGEGNLTFKVKSSEKPIIIQATSQFRSGASVIRVTSWINNHVIKVTPMEHVIFFVKVQHGVYPVSGARVIATVYYPNSTSSYKMQLLDNGLGDPDVTANDGIYSRSFTAFGTKGYYFLSINVDDNDGNARIIRGFENENKICCGSFIPDLNSIETGPFSRISTFGSFYLSHDALTEDTYSPNRITDLRATVLSKHDRKVRLTWTAPGSNYDNDDKVSLYQIKYYRDVDELLTRQKEPCANDLNQEVAADSSSAFCVELNDFNLISGKLEEAVMYGEEETREIRLNAKYFLDDLYFIIYALDQANNTSPMSNIAPAFVPKVPEPTTEQAENSTAVPQTSGGLASGEIGMIVGIVLGALVLIAITVLALIWFCRRRKRKDSQDDAMPQTAASQPPRANGVTRRPNGVENGNSISEVSSWSARTLMDHYDSVRDAKKQTISKPIMSIHDVLDDTGSDYKVEKNDMYEPAYSHKQAENMPYNPTRTSQHFQNSTPKKTTQV